MGSLIRIGFAVLTVGYFLACSPVKFEGVEAEGPRVEEKAFICEKVQRGDIFVQKCVTEKMVGEGLVDILIVNDNSGSMSTEQAKMADRFSTFVQSMGSLDYRIAMITTDVSSHFSSTPAGVQNLPAEQNGNGKWQDGNLIEFAPGVKFLDRSTPNKETLFANTIKRQETLTCEQSGYQNCPSGDERGIFAANLALDKEGTVAQFMRPTAHLAIIILSDEDERGLSDPRSVQTPSDEQLRQMYPLENYDLPQTLVSRFQSRYPDKTLSAHSIVVPDNDCRDKQTGQSNSWIRGVVGYSYIALSSLTGGKVGTICADDYGSQLTQIGFALKDRVTSLPFQCRPLNDNEWDVKYNPKPVNAIDVVADFNNMSLNIKGELPPLTKVRLEYFCAAP